MKNVLCILLVCVLGLGCSLGLVLVCLLVYVIDGSGLLFYLDGLENFGLGVLLLLGVYGMVYIGFV